MLLYTFASIFKQAEVGGLSLRRILGLSCVGNSIPVIIYYPGIAGFFKVYPGISGPIGNRRIQ